MVSCKFCLENAACQNKGLPTYVIRQLIIADSFELFNDRFNALVANKVDTYEITVEDIMEIAMKFLPSAPKHEIKRPEDYNGKNK